MNAIIRMDDTRVVCVVSCVVSCVLVLCAMLCVLCAMCSKYYTFSNSVFIHPSIDITLIKTYIYLYQANKQIFKPNLAMPMTNPTHPSFCVSFPLPLCQLHLLLLLLFLLLLLPLLLSFPVLSSYQAHILKLSHLVIHLIPTDIANVMSYYMHLNLPNTHSCFHAMKKLQLQKREKTTR